MPSKMVEFTNVKDFELFAKNVLSKPILDYYRSGACGELTLCNNQAAFNRLRILPRILRDVRRRDTNAKILGMNVTLPIGIAPSAMQKMAHPEGECANARAAGAMGTIYVLSTLATTSIEDVAKAAPHTIKWFQLYIYKDRDLTTKLIRRAEKAGFRAIVLTVDANVFGIRYADAKNSFQLPDYLKLGNFVGNESELKTEDSGQSGLNIYVQKLFDMSVSWKDVEWLKSITKLPIILKGILTVEDAIMAADAGVAGIVVSNHGGRQLDTVPATIEALPEIAKAVGHRLEIMIDGGIRYGSDIFKALALGAKMVFVGRPALWGLAANGEEGVKEILNVLLSELKTTMGLAGCNEIADIKREMVIHEAIYSKI